jgi:hypothetical protein
MKTLELNKMEGIEGGAGNGYACAGGILVTVALGAFAFANPLAFMALGPEAFALGAAAAGAIYDNC